MFLSYLSSDPSGGWQLVHGVHVPFLHLHAADDEFLRLLLVHVVQVQGVDLGGQVTADLEAVFSQSRVHRYVMSLPS